MAISYPYWQSLQTAGAAAYRRVNSEGEATQRSGRSAVALVVQQINDEPG